MREFLTALGDFAFLRYALAGGLLVSIAGGVVGSLVVTRRLTALAGGIAHFILGGMGGARYLNKVHGIEWLSPLHGALAAAMLAAVIMTFVRLRAKEREDTLIGALWALGMAAGVLFIWRTPGYNEDLMAYLFGDILLMSREDLIVIAILDAVILAAAFGFYGQLVAVCFDEEFARLRGLPVDLFYFVFLCLTALTVVVLVTVVGVVMVLALLTLPVAAAGRCARRLWQMMALATVFISGLTTLGLAVSYDANLPAGATIVMLAGALYAVVTFGGMALARVQARARARR